MIREMHSDDLDLVMKIWLETNTTSHYFIDHNYWIDQYSNVEKMLFDADIFVYELDTNIVGFIGIINCYIAGIFINNEYQGKGIGKKLLDFCKAKYSKLNLDVYKKNERAISFYLKNNFIITETNSDKNTNELEYRMKWEKENG